MAFYTDEQVAQMQTQHAQATGAKPDFWGAVSGDVNKRIDTLAEGYNRNPNPMLQGFQTVGAGAGIVKDIAARTAKTLTPQPVKDVIKEKMKYKPFGLFGDMIAGGVQTVTPDIVKQSIKDLAVKTHEEIENNPDLKQGLDSAMNIADVFFGLEGANAFKNTLRDMAGSGIKSVASGTESGVKVGARGLAASGDYAKSRVPKLLGIFSCENNDVIEAALRNPKVADLGIEQGDLALRNVVREGSENSVKLKNDFIKGFSEAKKKVMGSYTKTLIPKSNVVGKFNELLRENKVIINRDGTLDFTTSFIKANPGEISKIQAAYDALKKWDKFDIDSLDEYKQLVGKLTRFASESGGSSKSPFLGKFYNQLNEIAYAKLPKDIAAEYKALNAKFSENIELYDDMVDAFNSGDPFSKLANSLGKNKDSLRQVLEFYEQKSGKDVLPIVAGRELAMEKTAAFGFLNPRSWVDFFISPKIQAKIVTGVGGMMQGAKK